MFSIRALRSFRYGVLVASIFVSSARAQAQSAPPPSAFEGYRLHSEKNPLINWRDANNFVEKLEGHMGHVRGGPRTMKPAPAMDVPLPLKADTPAKPPSPQMPKPTPSVDHSTHEMKKP